MKLRTKLMGALGLVAGLAGSSAYAIDLPACPIPDGTVCLKFGDFNVYSLALLGLQISATPGAIAPYTIIGQNNGQEGAGNVGNIDGTFATPSANQTPTFTTLTGAGTTSAPLDPGGTNQFTGDFQSWDADVSELLTMTDGTPLVAFFSFNETNQNNDTVNSLVGADMIVWARATLCQDGTTTSCESFVLGFSPTAPSLSQASLDLVTDPFSAAAQGWVYVHASICVFGNGDFAGFPDLVTGACPAGASIRNQTNLGQNNAAFMINSPDLDTALETCQANAGCAANGVFHVDWQMAYLNGGGESAWFQSVESVVLVPEPSVLALFGLGLLGAGFVGRRCKV